MQLLKSIGSFVAVLATIAPALANPLVQRGPVYKRTDAMAPKVVIISMFGPETEVWYGIPEFDIIAQNITVPGFSPLYPDIHCTADGEICLLTTGESEINAATTITALAFSPMFDLSKTYFMIAGIAGVNPKVGTLGGVSFAKYAIQVALQYEFDAREIPDNFTTGYIPLGADSPTEYPQNIYGTEVFEVNEALRDYAVGFASSANLTDSADAIAYRANYATDDMYTAATAGPSVIACDGVTSDVYYSGTLLSEAFENTTTLYTNGSGVYCATAQEDNASLEALLRSSAANLTDFSRIIVMRTFSDFDRPFPGESDVDNLFYAEQGGFEPAIQNIYHAGLRVVTGILNGWGEVFEAGVTPINYIGDILGTLGGTPDFGLPADFLDTATTNFKKRALERRSVRSRRRAVPIKRTE